jgi:hypothetical protein
VGTNADVSPHTYNPYVGLLATTTKETKNQATLLGIPSRGAGRARYEITKTLDGNVVNNKRTGNITKVTFKP